MAECLYNIFGFLGTLVSHQGTWVGCWPSLGISKADKARSWQISLRLRRTSSPSGLPELNNGDAEPRVLRLSGNCTKWQGWYNT